MRITPLAYRDVLEVFQPFSQDPVVALLDSAATRALTHLHGNSDNRSRYSYIAVEPFCIVRSGENGVYVDGKQVDGNPFEILQHHLSMCRMDMVDAPTPFAGGAVGYLAYEMGRHADRFPIPSPDPHAVPEMLVGLYDCVIAFDHFKQTSYLISTGLPAIAGSERHVRAKEREEHILHRLADAHPLPPINWEPQGAWQAERSREEIEQSIQQVIDYIIAGDIFQANLTQRMTATCPEGLDDFMLYRRLRALSPAPFAAMVRCGDDMSIMSASPERFLALDEKGTVETRPIKGTIRRDADPAKDAALAATLANSLKDRAENLMIVDLMRNDLARICQPGSVKVPALMEVETFASVHHLVSAVTGQLMPDRDAIDLMRACFPGGSITGAPKIRAMEIINELENRQRGVCFGSIMWCGLDGAMDSSIAIRTLVRCHDAIIAEAGGGIVADSIPSREFEEAQLKMRPLLNSLIGQPQ